VWIPATIWLFSQGQTGWGVFMLIWGMFIVSGVDNIIKPYLISHGSKIPFVLVFMGVIGGALAFGLVGVFLGPTLLAVGYRIVEEWSSVNALLSATAPKQNDQSEAEIKVDINIDDIAIAEANRA
jgi:predicted PurR-regulated permease PerM